MHMLLILLTLCLRKPYGISHLFSMVYAFAGNGCTKNDSGAEAAKKVEEGVEIVDDHTVIFHLKQATPEFVENISANADLVMESKARWDAGGKELYGQKVVGTGP